MLGTLPGHAKRVAAVACSPDGQRLASASDDKTVKVWDARSGQGLFTLQNPKGEVSAGQSHMPVALGFFETPLPSTGSVPPVPWPLMFLACGTV